MIDMSSGWNLINTYLEPEDPKITSMFFDMEDQIVSIWKWEDGKWAVYLMGQEDGGAAYADDKGFLLLQEIHAGEGFWVNCNDSQYLKISGTEPSDPAAELVPEWNLVGLKSDQAKSITDLVGENASNIASVWKWKDGKWAVYLPAEDDGGAAYAQNKGFSVLSDIGPGEGFWVNATQACVVNGDTPMVGKGEMTDSRDDQTYETIQIGDQIWMAENLKYLPEVSPVTANSTTVPYYFVYGYQGTTVSEAKATDNFKTYGALYNWPAALDACPDDWHLPSKEEWTTLINFLGGNAEGGKMKSTTHWSTPNTNATNESGWSGLPGGYRDTYGGGNFKDLGKYGGWWSDSKGGGNDAYWRMLFYYHGYAHEQNDYMGHGLSVRCVAD
jgi:uncharacterized protein (TIGR02145 family)